MPKVEDASWESNYDTMSIYIYAIYNFLSVNFLWHRLVMETRDANKKESSKSVKCFSELIKVSKVYYVLNNGMS